MKIIENEKGQYHCLDGPAIEYANGTKEWYINDRLHREDGPAIERTNGLKEWYIDGQFLFLMFKNRNNLKYLFEYFFP